MAGLSSPPLSGAVNTVTDMDECLSLMRELFSPGGYMQRVHTLVVIDPVSIGWGDLVRS